MRSPQLLAAGTATINMTPMIDVVFLLIIFFLVSSHLAKQENAVKLDLPTAVSGLEEEQERETLVVNILPDGQWRVAGIAMDETSLLASFRTGLQRSERGLRLKIRTDQIVTYRRIEPVLRLAAQAGIGDIVFSVYEER